MKKSMLLGIRSLLPGVLIAVGPLPGALAADLHVPSDYATIQAAVDAASSGDTIRIAPGDYYEQVAIVDKADLTLAGEPGTAIHATLGMTATLAPYVTISGDVIPILGIVRSEVLVTNLTFDGAGLGDSYTGLLRGIALFGSRGRIENCTVQEFRGATDNFARGISVFNPVSFGTPIINVSVRNSTFVNNVRSIVLTGDPANNPALLRTSFIIEGNTLEGLGATGTTENIGLIIWTGAAGEVKGNTMTGFDYPDGPTPIRAPIVHLDSQYASRGLLPVQAVRYEGNTFSNNDDHLVLFTANESVVVNNIFYGTGSAGTGPRWGGLSVSGTNIVVANNDFSGLPYGIHLRGNDQTFGGAAIKPASNVFLSANWFCGVTTPVSIRSGANAIQEQGTKLCENEPIVGTFRPVFQSIAPLAGGGATLTLRAWHGDTVAIEYSDDLKTWERLWSGQTHTMLLPTFRFEDVSTPHRFYRAVLAAPFDPWGFDLFGGCVAGEG